MQIIFFKFYPQMSYLFWGVHEATTQQFVFHSTDQIFSLDISVNRSKSPMKNKEKYSKFEYTARLERA